MSTHSRGLSPRVRGNPSISRCPGSGPWSIPAGAGEPRLQPREPSHGEVYPRGCGGTCAVCGRATRRLGLSPRVRGNPDELLLDFLGVGSIPAGAGEPRQRGGQSAGKRVYPRGCGGTLGWLARKRWRKGLSPRVRGNRRWSGARARRPGSIPAGAGEPAPGCGCSGGCWVYPRGCGGTAAQPSIAAQSVGLSPRVRGNPVGTTPVDQRRGSIPAGAGEPMRATRRGGTTRVYPRGCGGTGAEYLGDLLDRGLSPRVRGNRRLVPAGEERAGSIPAGAGEPRSRAMTASRSRVYPRGCGGTRDELGGPRRTAGLSPRVRGNRGRTSGSSARAGSIPAGAGEPTASARHGGRSRVYPRGCGGTASGSRLDVLATGLSPRVRGNLRAAMARPPSTRSIPAGAGEPSSCRTPRSRGRVYPRGCGGTHRPR